MKRRILLFVFLLGIATSGFAQFVAATLRSPVDGSQLQSGTQTFQWDKVMTSFSGVIYYLWIGSSPGTYDIAAAGTGGDSITVNGLPQDGRALYVRLWTYWGGQQDWRDFTYVAAAPGAGELTSPPDGATLADTTQSFTWNAASGASLYQLWIGSTAGSYDVGYFTSSGTSITVEGLPSDGRLLYVRLWAAIGATWQSSDNVYRAATLAAGVNSPSPGSTLQSSYPTFTWLAVPRAAFYQLWIGSTPGGLDLGVYDVDPSATPYAAVRGLPRDGRTLHVRLWTLVDGAFYVYRDHTYVAAPAPPAPSMDRPTPGTPLRSTETFSWTGIDEFYTLWIGSAPGSSDIATFGPAFSRSATISGLPSGQTLHARLWIGSPVHGSYVDYVYPASPTFVAAALTAPANGAFLAGSSQELRWNTTAGAWGYQVWLGSAPGMTDLGVYTLGATDTRVVAVGLPTDGGPVHVRLWSLFSTLYLHNDYSFFAAMDGPANIVWPVQGASFEGATQAFRWQAPPGAQGYQLWVGSTPGARDLGYFPEGLAMVPNVTATGLPSDGRRVHVRLWTAFPDGYQHRDFAYYARGSSEPAIPTPTLGWQLPGPSQAFGTVVGPAPIMTLGDSPGSAEYGEGSRGGLQTTYTGLPIDGRTLYGRVAWSVGAEQRFRDYEMTAAQPGPGAVMISPANDWALYPNSATHTFSFSDVGASAYRIWIGTTLGGQEKGEYPGPAGTTATSIAAPVHFGGLATYVRLWSLVGGVWHHRDYVYRHLFG